MSLRKMKQLQVDFQWCSGFVLFDFMEGLNLHIFTACDSSTKYELTTNDFDAESVMYITRKIFDSSFLTSVKI